MRKLFFFVFFLTLSILQVQAQTFTANSGTSVGLIPDGNPNGNCFPLLVSGIGTMSSAFGFENIQVNINHQYTGDLTLSLVDPSGVTVVLAKKVTGSGATNENFTNTVFSQTAPVPISAAAAQAPFTGNFLPQENLGAYNKPGNSADGIWTLCVVDDSPGDTGVVVNWSITFSNTPAQPPVGPGQCLQLQPAKTDCGSPSKVCDFVGLCGNTKPSTPLVWPALTSAFCGSIENNTFLTFDADSTAASFHIYVKNSKNGDGIQMFFFEGQCKGAVNSINCQNQIRPNTDTTPFLLSVTNMTIGKTYFLMFDGFAGDVCDYQIQPLTGISKVILTQTPTTANVCFGDKVIFTAGGTLTKYNWIATNNQSALSPDTGKKVVLNTSLLPLGVTRVTVKGTTPKGCSGLKVSTVNVVRPLTITQQPTPDSQRVYVNYPVTPITVVSPDTFVTYQWYRNTIKSYVGATPIPGATSPTYVPPVNIAGKFYYYCFIDNKGCSITSDFALVNVVVPPFCITPDALDFFVQPTNTHQGLRINPAVVVRAMCSSTGVTGKKVGFVTLTASDGGCGYISQTKPFVNGLATFDSVVFTRSLQNNISLTASSPGFASVVSKKFNITKPIPFLKKDVFYNDDFSPAPSIPWRPIVYGPVVYSGSVGLPGLDSMGIANPTGTNYYLRKTFTTNNNQKFSTNTATFPNVSGLANLDTLVFSFKVASLDAAGLAVKTSNGSGVDINEDLIIETSTDNGVTWKKLLTHLGGNNKLFPFNPLKSKKLVFGTPFTCAANDSTSAFSVVIPKGFNDFKFRFRATDNRINENWALDDIKLEGVTIIPITSDTIPTVSIAGDTSVCHGVSVNLSAVPYNAHAPVKYSWFPDTLFLNNSDTLAVPQIKPLFDTTTIKLSIKDSDNCIGVSNPYTIHIVPPLKEQRKKLDSMSVCFGNSFDSLFYVVKGGKSYQWYASATPLNTGGTAIPGATDTGYAPQSFFPGTFYYYCVVTGSCLGDTLVSKVSGPITVNLKPTISILGKDTVCTGAFSSLLGSGGNKYIWSTGDTGLLLNFTTFNDTSFKVYGTDTITGCSDSASINIVVDSISAPKISIVQPTCTVQTGTINILFPTKNGISSSINNTDYFLDSLVYGGILKGTYPITLKNVRGCVSNTTFASIQPPVGALVLDLVTTKDSCLNTDTLHLLGASAATEIKWYLNGVLIATPSNLDTVWKPIKPGQYVVSANNSAGCLATSNSISIFDTVRSSVKIASNIVFPSCTHKVTFSATLINEGVSPKIEWFINRVPVGKDSTQYTTDSLKQNDTVFAIVKGSAKCVLAKVDTSNPIIARFTVMDTSITNLKICNGDTVRFNGKTYTTAGTYTSILKTLNGCDSMAILSLKVATPTDTIIKASICDGTPFVFNGVSYTKAGFDTIKKKNVEGCDSLIYLQIKVNNKSFTTIKDSLCYGDSAILNGKKYGATGKYVDTLVASSGCDSIVTLDLLVYPKPIVAKRLDSTVCQGSIVVFNGKNYSATGVYLDTLKSKKGCDSVYLSLSLNVKKAKDTVINIVTCDSFYVFKGVRFEKSIDTIFKFTTGIGCDSLINLKLKVKTITVTSQNDTLCFGDSTVFNGKKYKTTGKYTDTLTSSNGCDSIVTLNLFVYPKATVATTISQSICQGGAFLFNGKSYSVSGTYADTLKNKKGCDSVYLSLTLKVNNPTDSTIKDTSCTGFYDFKGRRFEKSIDTTYRFTNASGCDSLVYLKLTIGKPYSDTVKATICKGSAYLFEGQTITDSGYSKKLFKGAAGCDSLKVLHLTYRLPTDKLVDTTICEGTSLLYNGVRYSLANTYVLPKLVNSVGCDSIVTLKLSFRPKPSRDSTVNICSGKSFIYQGTSYSVSGIYTLPDLPPTNPSNPSDCGSKLRLLLTVNAPSNSTTFDTICEGQSRSFNGIQYTTPGKYSVTLSNAKGCDSVATLNLTVLPKPKVNAISGPNTVDMGLTVQLSNTVAGGIWSIKPTNIASIDQTGLVKGINGGTALVYYALSNKCGIDSAAPFTIKVVSPVVFVPNTFSPNGDGSNDKFFIQGNPATVDDVELRVFNSWGQLIFESKGKIGDPSIGWDGKVKGADQPLGVYIYVAKVRLKTGEIDLRKGSINLIR